MTIEKRGRWTIDWDKKTMHPGDDWPEDIDFDLDDISDKEVVGMLIEVYDRGRSSVILSRVYGEYE